METEEKIKEKCPECGSFNTEYYKEKYRVRLYYCKNCGIRFVGYIGHI